MVLAKALSSTLLGVDAHPVEVEVDLALGLPVFTTVGLPDAAVRESRDRVKAAMANCGFAFPSRRITVNLAPAHLRKAGRAFDLLIALGVLQAAGHIESEMLSCYQPERNAARCRGHLRDHRQRLLPRHPAGLQRRH